MQTQNVSTLKIHKLTQAQYDREAAAGNIDETALYLTPDEDTKVSDLASTIDDLQAELDSHATDLDALETAVNNKANASHTHAIADVTDLQSSLDAKAPAYTYSTTDLTAGTSSLATGKLYIVYE